MDILEMIQKNDMLKVILILVAVYFFMKYYNREGLDNVTGMEASLSYQPLVSQPLVSQPRVTQAELSSIASPVLETSVQQEQVEKIVAGSSQLSAGDLLPMYDDANDFAKQNPVSKLLQEQNFLQAGYHMGINTVIQSNKIPYLDIRSCPPIPKQEVGPFNNSSFEQPAGSNRRFLEIGN
jgi:hypothetical protein